ncbi:MAG: arabinogalactan endo-1,4-beta-galactosidase [Chloroflexi bacterium]|nr:MAG: arabinogalactan endo-1,4-beta-galactosidase [Chloroflexota bacterium]
MLTVTLLVPSSAAAHAVAEVANPGFEADNDVTTSPAGWIVTGTEGASYTEWGGHSGDWRLSNWSAEPYVVETSQTLTGLPRGWYTLRAWVKSGGGQNEAYIALKNCGSHEARTYLPVAPADRWLQIVVSTRVNRGRCTISLYSDANAGNWANFDDIEFVPGQAELSILGADISSLKKSEDFGGIYRTESGKKRDALRILESYGMNWARLRVWVDPADGYHDKEELLEMAKRIRQNDMQLLVDLHYSDTWADPGHQEKPAAWESLPFEELKQAVYDHTYDVCISLKKQHTPPAIIQLGNELNSGMLWPDGHTWNPPNWDNLAQLLTAGYDAVKDCSPKTRVMLHLANGGDNGLYRWWFDNITLRGVPFDLIGLSYYSYWHGSLADLQYNLNDISATYDKDVVVMETAYPFTLADDDGWENIIDLEGELTAGYPATPEGQTAMLRDVMSIVRAVPNGRGLGVFYWDATWTGVPGNGWDPTDPSSGNAWENQALFDFDDRPVPALNEFKP